MFFLWATFSLSFFAWNIQMYLSSAVDVWMHKDDGGVYSKDAFVFSRANEQQNNRSRVWNTEARCEMRAVNRHRQWTSLTRWPTDTLAHILGLSHTDTLRAHTHTPCNSGHPEINGQRDAVWQAIEPSTALMRPAASGDWLEELYQYVSITTVQQQRLDAL